MDWKQAGRSDQKNDPAFWDRGGRKGGLEGQCLCMGGFGVADAFKPGYQSMVYECLHMYMYRSIGGYVCRKGRVLLLTCVVQCKGSMCLFWGRMLCMHPKGFAWVAGNTALPCLSAELCAVCPAPVRESLNISLCVCMGTACWPAGREGEESGWMNVGSACNYSETFAGLHTRV